MKLKDQDILQRPHSSFLHQQRTSLIRRSSHLWWHNK